MLDFLKPRVFFRFVTQFVLFDLLILSLIFPAQIFANTSTSINKSGVRPTNATLKNAVELIKLFQTTQDVLNFLVAVNPKSGLGQWNEYFKNKKADLKSVALSNLRYESNRINLPGIEEPFTVSGDGLTYTYRGVAFTFNMKQSPEQNIRRMHSAWKEFKSLGFAANRTRSLMTLFIPQATAVSTEKAVEVAQVSAWVLCVAILAYLMVDEGIAFAVGVIALSVSSVATIAALAYAALWISENGNQKVKDLELRCSPISTLWESNSQKQVEISSIARAVPPVDPSKLRIELARICKEGQTPVGMFNMKLKTVISAIKRNEIQFSKSSEPQVPKKPEPSGAAS